MKALALFSGGLDSMLAAKIISDLGVEVIALYVDIGFGGKSDVDALLKERAEKAGASFMKIDVRSEYLRDILFDPKYGYGKNFNPCIDCHGYMFKVAKGLLDKFDASFIITGEVLGQRPMSQRADAMMRVSMLAGDKEDKLILRPLSAKLMEISTPEQEGWVEREKLHDISGRNRQQQLALASKYGWEDYQSPGGGCLLTEIHYSARIREHIKYDTFELEDIEILKFGRHFRLEDGAKLVVGRDEADNTSLEAIDCSKYTLFELPVIGPTSVIRNDATQREKALAAKIAISYAKSKKDTSYEVEIAGQIFEVTPFANKKEIEPYFFDAKQ